MASERYPSLAPLLFENQEDRVGRVFEFPDPALRKPSEWACTSGRAALIVIVRSGGKQSRCSRLQIRNQQMQPAKIWRAVLLLLRVTIQQRSLLETWIDHHPASSQFA